MPSQPIRTSRALRRKSPPAVPVHEMRRHARAVLLERNEMVTGKYIVGADPLLHRGQQDHLQIATVDRVLRPGISGGEPAWLGPDQLAELVVIAEFRGLDRRRSQCVAEAELDQFAHRIRLQIDADAERLDVDGQFVDLRIDAGRMKAERGRKSANAGPDHHHLHRRAPDTRPSNLVRMRDRPSAIPPRSFRAG